MDIISYVLIITILINMSITYKLWKKTNTLSKKGVGKQGPPGPKGSRGEPCKCTQDEKEYKIILTDENDETLMELNNTNEKPWADYIEESE